MCSRFLEIALLLGLITTNAAAARILRVCADPANLPFSNRAQQGFENRIATLLADDLHARLLYVWQRMGRGFVRDYVNKGRCDLLVGIPAGYKTLLTTHPYYRSTYVFVTRRGGPELATFNDPALHGMKLGVQILDENYAPPGEALARRGMSANLVGFESTGSDADSIMRAVVRHKVDAAVVWGPLAGYFARRYGNRLRLTAVEPEIDPPALPFTFAIAMGVRKANAALLAELNAFLRRRQSAIHRILDSYGVPQLALAEQKGN